MNKDSKRIYNALKHHVNTDCHGGIQALNALITILDLKDAEINRLHNALRQCHRHADRALKE